MKIIYFPLADLRQEIAGGSDPSVVTFFLGRSSGKDNSRIKQQRIPLNSVALAPESCVQMYFCSKAGKRVKKQQKSR